MAIPIPLSPQRCYTGGMSIRPLALKPPDPRVRIRPVSRQDIPALRRLWPNRSETEVMQLVNRVLRQAEQRRGLGVVAVGRDEYSLTGYGQLTLWSHAAEIADLAVAETERGRGLGTGLIQYLVRTAQEMRALRVEIGAALSNFRAVALYRRLGFRDGRAIMVDLGNGLETVLYFYLDFSQDKKP